MPPLTYGSAHKPTAAGFCWFTLWPSGISGRKSSSIRWTYSSPTLFLCCNGAASGQPCFILNAGKHVKEQINVSVCSRKWRSPPVRVFEWFQRFREGREDLEDHLRNGRPSTEWNQGAVAKVRELVLRINRLTLKLIDDQLHINLEKSDQIHNEDLERGDVRKSLFHTASWRRCAQKFVPHSFMEEMCANVCSTQPHGGDVRKSLFHTSSWRRCAQKFVPHRLM